MSESVNLATTTPKRVAKVRTPKSETRGAYYGINATALAASSKRKLDKIRAQVQALQEPWLDADPLIEQAVTKLMSAIDDAAKQFKDSAEYMNEPMDA